MKVLFIGPLPEPTTGQSLACQVLLDALRQRHEVEVVNLSKNTFRQGVSSPRRVAEVGAILREVRRASPADVVYLTIAESIAGNLKDLAIYVVCRHRLRRLVTHLHGGAGIRRILLGRRHPLRRANEHFMRRLGGVIVLGSRQVDLYSHLVAPDRLHVVPNFAQDALFIPVDAIDTKFAEARPLRVLFLSNLLPGKGYLELLDAFERLSPATQSLIRLDFAGGFESPADESRFLQRILHFPGVTYHGTVRGDAKRALFQQAHVFCLPTYYAYEGQPISILESYAAGCAVITTNHSGIGDIFTADANGIEVEARSVTSLQGALERAVQGVDTLHAMARANRAEAEACYRTDSHTDRLVAILESTAARARREEAQ